MSTVFDKFERFGRKTYNGQDVLKNHILKIFPIHRTDNTSDESVAAQYADQDEYVWIVDNSITVLDSFPWHFRPNVSEEPKRHAFPYVYKGSKRIKSWDAVKLVPTKQTPVETVEHKNICAYYDVYCGKDKFDVFYVGEHEGLLKKAPHAIQVKDHAEAQKLSTTDMFWFVPDDVQLGQFFKFGYRPDDWSHKYVHVFGNGNNQTFDGVALFPKKYQPVQKELTHRFYAEKKEVKIIASFPKPYPVYNFKNYKEYCDVVDTINSDLFWYVPNDVELSVELKLYFDHHNQYDRRINHVFLNNDEYDGVALFSKHSKVTEKEFNHRFYANKKEHPEKYSKPKKFDRFVVNNYADYKLALERSTTEMFWGVPDDVVFDDAFEFDIYFSHHNRYDRSTNHVFLNGEHFDGIALFSKNSVVTEKEIEHRFYANKKEWPINASYPLLYPVYDIETYDQYLQALEESTSDLFWMSSPNISVFQDIYGIYLSYHDQSLRKQNHVFLHKENNGASYNGLILCSKFKPLTQREVEYRHPVERIEHDKILSRNKKYDIFFIDSYNDYLEALETSETELFWMSTLNIDTNNFDFNFTFDFSNTYDRKTNHAFVHLVNGVEYYNGLFLCSKYAPLTQKEVEYRHLVNGKHWDIVGSTHTVYDRFSIETYEDYLYALDNSETELFWGHTNNIDVKDFGFDLYFTHDNEYDRKQNHSFIHRVGDKDYRNGVFLYSKHKPLTQKEIEYRHIVSGKEWDIVASKPVKYDTHIINNYDDYMLAMDISTTEMFWGIPSDIEVCIDFNFDLYFTHDNEYDRKTNHVFLNGEHYDGVVLFSKHAPVTQREIENRFYVNKKEWNVVASTPKQYDTFIVETYNDYLFALDNSKTDMFWASSNNIKLKEDFDLGLYFSHHNSYDRNINHVFAHKVGNEIHYNGLFLLSKHVPVTQKEIEHRLIVKRKEWNTVASGPVEYNKFKVNNYSDYEYARKNSKTEMFWLIPGNVEVSKDFEFDLYFTHNQWFERTTNHVFKNGNAWDGISLVSTKSNITEREIQMRFFAEKKQYDIVASNPMPYDIVFISKDEVHADENYAKLLAKYPRAKRVHGVEGIHQAHIEAAKLCNTDMFWVVDADAEIIDGFEFDYYVPEYDPSSKQSVHVWKSQNPVNGLVYGYGGVKLFPTELTINMDTSNPDMTTSISKLFKPINRISNITKFNTDEFSTWRSAFRECVKLSSRTIKGQLDEETEFRLNAWCTRGKDKLFGEYCIAGAKAGKAYGEANKSSIEDLKKINNFDWLYEQFKKSYPQLEK